MPDAELLKVESPFSSDAGCRIFKLLAVDSRDARCRIPKREGVLFRCRIGIATTTNLNRHREISGTSNLKHWHPASRIATTINLKWHLASQTTATTNFNDWHPAS